jgi:hypothetical protein
LRHTAYFAGKPLHLISFEPENTKVQAVREALMSWFDKNGRDLPWRRTRDPWSILVSEVMLQQIQVKCAIPFYEAFLRRFVTPRALAEAPLAEYEWNQALIEFQQTCTCRQGAFSRRTHRG